MQLILSLLISLSCLLSFSYADEEDSQSARRAAAIHYMNVNPTDIMMKDAVEKMAETMPEDQREYFKEVILKHLRQEVIEGISLNIMVKHFTAQELNALADFYGSEVGRSAMKKFDIYLAEIMPFMRQEMLSAMKSYKAEKSKVK